MVGLEIRGSSHWVCRVLWSIKKIRPSVWTRSSHPSGRGPRSSSCRRLGTLDWTGKAEGRPDLGSTQVVFLSLWLMKKTWKVILNHICSWSKMEHFVCSCQCNGRGFKKYFDYTLLLSVQQSSRVLAFPLDYCTLVQKKFILFINSKKLTKVYSFDKCTIDDEIRVIFIIIEHLKLQD